MSVIALTGSAGGLGRAIRERLESDGNRVIGVDLREAEVVADLSTEAGCQSMVAEVVETSHGALDGLVFAAGIQSAQAADVICVDGGTDAKLRSDDWPRPLDGRPR